MRLATAASLTGIAWLWLCSTALFADYLMGTLEEGFPPRAMSVIRPADAIVVLGGAIRGDVHMGTLGDLNQQADRLLHAAFLYREGKAPVVLVSGGAAAGDRPEAEAMADILKVMGVPPKALLRERVSRDTRDNARFSAELLKSREMKRILLVTSAFHMRRARALFEAEGLEVIPAPTDYQRLASKPTVPRWLPTADDLVRTTVALREQLGYYVYRFRGWL